MHRASLFRIAHKQHCSTKLRLNNEQCEDGSPRRSLLPLFSVVSSSGSGVHSTPRLLPQQYSVVFPILLVPRSSSLPVVWSFEDSEMGGLQPSGI
jgi:hypothetical protein